MDNVTKAVSDYFKLAENTSQFNKDFIENYNEEVTNSLTIDVQYLQKLHELTNNLPIFT